MNAGQIIVVLVVVFAAIIFVWVYVFKVNDADPVSDERPGLELGPADELRPQAPGSALTPTGWLMLVAGVAMTIGSLAMDISAPGYDGIANMDAISRRAMVFEAGLALAVIGVVLATAGHVVTVLRESTRGSRGV
ncbi:hypothetical protein [Novosphingobium sp. EMRT-2]|uniref:hypothetical protein n=1 Tax=Novosphingobium sp. EMRT-2 TaxID=2571749 RepID=UPI0010BD13C7|nr:hypothetical protein [Novosphingobium sp. EMRT-2]QCI92295.1 hypothetical protein FA702_01070 [Novosphingobium sp. EMRT-2]